MSLLIWSPIVDLAQQERSADHGNRMQPSYAQDLGVGSIEVCPPSRIA